MRLLDRVVAVVAGTLVAATVVITCAAVFYRYVLGSALAWPEEIAAYLLVWISFLGAYLGLRSDGHISFDMLVEKLPAPALLGLRTAIDLVLVVFFAVILVLSIRLIAVVGATEIETVAIPQGVFMAVLPVASAVILAALVTGIIGRFRGRR